MKATKWILCSISAVVLALALAGCNNANNTSGTDTTGGADTTGTPHTHSFGRWEVSKDATCTEKGEQKRTCACGETETQEIEKIAHSFGQWEVSKAATCAEKGEEKRTCACGEAETRELAALEHDYGQWTLSVEPSATQEGKLERVCSRDGSHKEYQSILRTPTVSYENGAIVWEKVENATAYDLYIDAVPVLSLGDVQTVPATKEGTYTIVARTDAANYRAESEQSNAVSVTYGDNTLPAGNVQSIANITDVWRFNIANFSGKRVTMMEKDGKTVVRLDANAAATVAVGGATIRPNMTVAVEFDVKVEGSVGEMNLGLFYAPDWQIPPVNVQIPTADENGWAHIRYEYTYGDTVPADAAWGNFDIRYVCEEAQGNVAYVANFQILRVDGDGDVRIDTANFCANKLNDAIDTWYLEFLKYGNYAENEIAFEGENAMLKLTDTDTPDASFIMASGGAFGGAGTYKLTMKVKLGADAIAANIGNIGFEIQSDGTPNGQLVEFEKNAAGGWDLKQDEWTTIEAYVTIAEKNCTWINLRFYFFTNNNVNPSADNYILVDDITVQLQQGNANA